MQSVKAELLQADRRRVMDSPEGFSTHTETVQQYYQLLILGQPKQVCPSPCDVPSLSCSLGSELSHSIPVRGNGLHDTRINNHTYLCVAPAESNLRLLFLFDVPRLCTVQQ